LLRLDNVRKTYNSVVAVDSISFDIHQGEFLTLLGPSGSGKTTTLVMLAGFVKPSSGAIYLRNKPLDPLPPYKRDIGMVFQQYALFPHMTVEQNVAFPLQIRKMPRDEIQRKVRSSLGKVGLGQFGSRRPKELSGGQQQRVALARAMVFEPSLLLMDEPLGALDKKLREQLQIEIMRLHRELNITIVYVTHDQSEALVMSDRIALFNSGRIEQLGSPTELYDTPASHFAADFIGDSNFFNGTVIGIDNGIATVEQAGGSRLRARLPAGSRLSAGKPAIMAVRPERIALKALGARPPEPHEVAAKLTDIVYLGRDRKYMARNDAGAEFSIVEALDVGATSRFEIGEAVALSWKPESGICLAP
jgi:putative spermidine/putrescine transport system ATP-binding protein